LRTVACGQRVATIFGKGSVLAFEEAKDGSTGAKYRVKLSFGMAYLSPSALLYAVATTDQPYVRRDGLMVRDDSLCDKNVTNSPRLTKRCEMLFGTDNIYLFLRLYSLICSLLSDTREHCETSEKPDDPEADYLLQGAKESKNDDALPKMNFDRIVFALKLSLAKKIDSKELDSLVRKLTKEKVHQFAALPKLIERCVDALIVTAREDCLLYLYDMCKYRSADPVAVRTRCFAVASEAVYRIQYDRVRGVFLFNYLPKDLELLTSPAKSDDNTEDLDDVGDPMDEDFRTISGDGQRPTKRTKLSW
jgi:hypothetical protein